MKDYEIVIRLHDPAFEQTKKKAILYTKDAALNIWNEAKVNRRPVQIEDSGEVYLVSPGDILQVRQVMDGAQGGRKTAVNDFKRRLIFSQKEKEVVFEVVSIKKLAVGCGDCEYKEVGRMTYDKWNKTSGTKEEKINLREAQDKFIAEMTKKHIPR